MRKALAGLILIFLAASSRAEAEGTIFISGADLVNEISLVATPAAGPQVFIPAAPVDQLKNIFLDPPPAELRAAMSEVPFRVSIPLIKR